MDDKRFWSMIEDAWQNVDGSTKAREKLARGELSAEATMDLAEQSLNEFVPALQEMLEQLPKDELMQFDRILERKLYDLDRADIHEYADGSEDGFLYSRAFIVAAGQAYYEAVLANPARALMDTECEDLCYLPVRVYAGKFGKMADSGISRETRSNKAGWSESPD